MKFKVFISLLFLFFGGSAWAQGSAADSVKKEISLPTVIRYIKGNAFSSPGITYYTPDTTLDYLEVINPAIRKHYNYLSNAGSAASPQVFNFREDIFTDIGFHSYDLYLVNDEKIKYFKTNKAFTELNYHLSAGKEQQINAALSQNILKNWNIGIDFNRLGSTGFLKNGTTFHTNVDLYTWFHSANNRYNLLAFAYWNTIDNKVNGGLHSDSIYDNGTVSNLALQGLLVQLTDAKHRFSNRKFSLRQFYDLDTNRADSTSNSVKKNQLQPSSRIEHSISLEACSFTYADTKPGDYYRNFYFSASTLDSLHYYDLRNRISFSSVMNRNDNYFFLVRNLFYSVALENQWIRFQQFANTDLLFNDEIIRNTSLTGSLENQEKGSLLHWKVAGNYIFDGENKSDYKGEVQLHAPLGSFGSLELNGKMMQKSPELIYRNYYSNHFIWENTFAKNMVKSFSIEYAYPAYHVSLGLEFTSLSNLVYPDSTLTPVLSSGGISIVKYFLVKNFHYRKFHFNNSFILQKVNHKNLLHLPELISTQSLYYESFLYNKALLLRIGFDLHFNSAYYADAFMPATGMFYRQYGKKTGGFPLTDFFISFRIKTANVFVKLENIGDGVFGEGYYLTPHYPMHGMAFQLGVKWRFFDQ